MKKDIVFKLCGKDTAISYNILRLSKFEKAIGQSLFFVMSAGGVLKAMDINFTLAGLAYGLKDELTIAEAAELVQKHCDEGGLLDDINDAIYRAIVASGLFIKTDAGEATKETE